MNDGEPRNVRVQQEVTGKASCRAAPVVNQHAGEVDFVAIIYFRYWIQFYSLIGT